MSATSRVAGDPLTVTRGERALLRISLLRGFSDPGYLPAVGFAISGEMAQATRVRAVAEWKMLDLLGWSAESDGGPFVLDLPDVLLAYALVPVATRADVLAGSVNAERVGLFGLTPHRSPDAIDTDAAELAERLLARLPLETKALAMSVPPSEQVAAVLHGDHLAGPPPLPSRSFDRLERDVLVASTRDCLRAAPLAVFLLAIESVDPREALLLRSQIEAGWQLLDGLGWTRSDGDAFEQTVSDEQLARVVLWIESRATARDHALPDDHPGGEDEWIVGFCLALRDTLPKPAVEDAWAEVIAIEGKARVTVVDYERRHLREVLLRGLGSPGYLAEIGTGLRGSVAQLWRARALAEWQVLDAIGWSADVESVQAEQLDLPAALRAVAPDEPDLELEVEVQRRRAFFDRVERDVLRSAVLDCLRRVPVAVFVSLVIGRRTVREALQLRARIEAAWRLLDDFGWDEEDGCDEFTQTISDEHLARVLLWIENGALDRVDALPEHDPAAKSDDWLARFCAANLNALPREAIHAASTVPGA